MEMDMNRTFLFAMTLAVTGLGLATSADAADWRWHHPRRVEVNHRLNHQAHRINVERREGELSARQAAYLHTEDRGIRAQERFDASREGGHITRGQQARLNHEENQVSRQIGQ
jgi:hypothetical protein